MTFRSNGERAIDLEPTSIRVSFPTSVEVRESLRSRYRETKLSKTNFGSFSPPHPALNCQDPIQYIH